MSTLLLEEFEQLFKGKTYRHRASTQGDWLARFFYEDLYNLGLSETFKERVNELRCVVNTRNRVTGIESRRGDGTFGETLPGSEPVQEPGYRVGIGPTANLQIGVEVKILAKSMIKQIDRVINDLRNQAREFREVNPSAIAVAIVGVNHAEKYVSYERDRTYTAEERESPAREAPKAIERLVARAKPHYDEFLVLPYRASNLSPYPFSWIHLSNTTDELNAALLRTLRRYEERFR